MIIAERKPLEEIAAMAAPYKKICVLGCNTCVGVCMAGGEKEAAETASLLRIHRNKENQEGEVDVFSLERQCEFEFIDEVLERLKSYDLIISLACGVGVQTMVEHVPSLRVVPGLNTTSMGYPTEQGVWSERCLGCGDCVLHLTMGVCPITRCAKTLLNGPCGGSAEGLCEVGEDIPCAWQLIHDRLSSFSRLNDLDEIQPPKDWSTSHHGGPRTTVREDVRIDRGE